jgi:glycosyltransferase involved in cell wall biosynthesis
MVTVVIPTRDRWPLLANSLATALAQEDVELEVIVVDDGSVDETPEQLASLRDERLRVLRLGASHGVGHARNRGVAEARGRWIAFLDDDDLWAPSKLRDQLEIAGEAVLVFTASCDIDLEGRVVGARRITMGSDLISSQLDSNVIGSPSSVLVRAEVLRRVGGFDERLAILADWDLWLRLLEEGRAAFVNEVLVAYRVHADNMHRSNISGISAELRYLRKKHRALARERRVIVGGPTFCMWLAAHYRAHGLRLDAARQYLGVGFRYRRPRDFARGLGLVFGERALRFAGSGGEVPGQEPEPVPRPAWLDA